MGLRMDLYGESAGGLQYFVTYHLEKEEHFWWLGFNLEPNLD